MPDDLKEIGNINELAEHIARAMTSIANMPQFGQGGVPTDVAAKVYGKSALWVKTGMEDGWLPIGHITRSENRVNVYISPKKLWEDTGYIWEGN